MNEASLDNLPTYTDSNTAAAKDKVIASAKKRFGKEPSWFMVRQRALGSGRDYALLRMGIPDDAGQCEWWAHVDRRGRVTWYKPGKFETWAAADGPPN